MDNGPAVGDLGHRVGNWLRVIPPASIRMGQYQMGMVVKLFLCSGGERTVDAADSARLDGPFFLVRRWYPDLNRTETVLTLRSEDVLGAEVLKDGVRIDYIPGCGQAKT